MKVMDESLNHDLVSVYSLMNIRGLFINIAIRQMR